MLCVIIGQVNGSRGSVDVKLALVAPILEPVESHIYCLGPLLFYCFIDKTDSCCVVYLNGRRRLFVPQFFEASNDGNTFLSC